MSSTILPRLAEPLLAEELSDSPVVLIHGARQTGKTTLSRLVGDRRGHIYFNFDDDTTRATARSDPVGFIANAPARVTFDEVQRVPEIFPAIKTAVDRDRVPGRFLLTGSTNVLLLPGLSESLAGRMAILRLHPLAQAEIARSVPRFLESLFGAEVRTERYQRLGRELGERIVAGGYPAAVARTSERRRSAWYRDYVETLVQRDVRNLSRIRSLDAIPRLLTLAASRTAQLLNVSDLAGPFQVSRPTVREYLTLLERQFLIEQIPPWHSSQLKRLVRTPKLHFGDTGVACSLLGVTARDLSADRKLLGQLLETFVFQELRREADSAGSGVRFHHYRDKDKVEVDFVLERGAREIFGIEVKSAASVAPADFRGLRRLARAVGSRFRAGVVLYDGEISAGLGDRLFAVPIRALWEGPQG